MLRCAQKRCLSSSSTVQSLEGMDEKLLELRDGAAVLVQRCKWELQFKSVYNRRMLERDEIGANMSPW